MLQWLVIKLTLVHVHGQQSITWIETATEFTIYMTYISANALDTIDCLLSSKRKHYRYYRSKTIKAMVDYVTYKKLL